MPLVLAAAALGILALTLQPRLLNNLLAAAFDMPKWATFLQAQMTPNYYRYFISDNFPVLFFTYPLAVLWLTKHRPSLGLLVLAVFAPLFLLHSYVFVHAALEFLQPVNGVLNGWPGSRYRRARFC